MTATAGASEHSSGAIAERTVLTEGLFSRVCHSQLRSDKPQRPPTQLLEPGSRVSARYAVKTPGHLVLQRSMLELSLSA